MAKWIFIFLVLTMGFSGYSQEHLKHEQWTALLQKHVDHKGHVNYEGFKKDEAKLDAYLKILSEHHPTSSWDKDDQLAFWINAYNAFTVKLIVKNLPVKSIKELGGSIYKVNTPWDIKFIHIGEETYDLNNIEHGIIRKDFDEPRIHFAVNCASVSCPILRNEAYVGDKLDEQLKDQAHRFINDGKRNKLSKGRAELSKIFKWYGQDFKDKYGSYLKFINRHTEHKISNNTEVTFLEYNWDLND